MPSRPFKARHWSLHDVDHHRIEVVPHHEVHGLQHFQSLEQQIVDQGYEGVMIRGIHGQYKFGRATHNDQILWKFKRFSDGEAVVTGLEEGVHNHNPQTVDALGRSKRSNHQDGMVGAGRVGTILATNVSTGQQLRVSPGEMTMEDRAYYWQRPHELVGKVITIKWFDYGILEQPRFCTFKALFISMGTPPFRSSHAKT
jgi:DNA ligase 1